MKNLILNALKAKFVGVSENILNRMAEKLAKTVTKEDDVAAAVEAVTFQQVIDSESDRRATDATQSAVTNYEKKHGLKDGQKVDGGKPTEEPTQQGAAQGGDLASIVAAAVTNAVKPLQDEINAIKTGKVADTRQQQLNAVIEKLPEKLRKPYTRISVKDMMDDDFTAFISETETEVEGVLSEYNSKSAVFNAPLGGGGAVSKKEPSKEEVEAVLGGLI